MIKSLHWASCPVNQQCQCSFLTMTAKLKPGPLLSHHPGPSEKGSSKRSCKTTKEMLRKVSGGGPQEPFSRDLYLKKGYKYYPNRCRFQEDIQRYYSGRGPGNMNSQSIRAWPRRPNDGMYKYTNNYYNSIIKVRYTVKHR